MFIDEGVNYLFSIEEENGVLSWVHLSGCFGIVSVEFNFLYKKLLAASLTEASWVRQ